MISIEELDNIRTALRGEAADALATYHKALGAIELADHLRGSLEEKEDPDGPKPNES